MFFSSLGEIDGKRKAFFSLWSHKVEPTQIQCPGFIFLQTARKMQWLMSLLWQQGVCESIWKSTFIPHVVILYFLQNLSVQVEFLIFFGPPKFDNWIQIHTINIQLLIVHQVFEWPIYQFWVVAQYHNGYRIKTYFKYNLPTHKLLLIG